MLDASLYSVQSRCLYHVIISYVKLLIISNDLKICQPWENKSNTVWLFKMILINYVEKNTNDAFSHIIYLLLTIMQL
jgi:hypothetical protein